MVVTWALAACHCTNIIFAEIPISGNSSAVIIIVNNNSMRRLVSKCIICSVKSDVVENDEMTKPDSSTVSPGDENNNSHNKSRRKPMTSSKCRKLEKKMTSCGEQSVGSPGAPSSSQPNVSVVQVC